MSNRRKRLAASAAILLAGFAMPAIMMALDVEAWLSYFSDDDFVTRDNCGDWDGH